jgi:hypothetical protein
MAHLQSNEFIESSISFSIAPFRHN